MTFVTIVNLAYSRLGIHKETWKRMTNDDRTLGGASNTPPPPGGEAAPLGSLVPTDPLACVYAAGVDYWSATLPWSHPLYDALYAQARAVAHIPDSGVLLKPTSLQGYVGHTGNQVFIGQRHDGAFVSCSGAGAERVFRRLAGGAWRTSRIDLEVTLWMAGQNTAAMRAVRETGALTMAGQSGAAFGARVTSYAANDGGSTLYVGAASAHQRGRCYDKGVQSREQVYDGSIRYEVQYRHGIAESAAKLLIGLPGDAERWIVQHVMAWWRARGVDVPLDIESAYATQVSVPKVRSDTYRRLIWLRESVRPAIAKLLLEVSADDVRAILGL